MPASSGSTAKRLGAAAGLLTIAVLLSRILGFAREAFIAGAFGATGETDAFYAAFTIPDMLNYLVAGGTLSITLIPIYARHLASGDEAQGNRVFSTLATLMAMVVGVAIVVLELGTPKLVLRYFWRFQATDKVQAIALTRILLPAQLFFYLGGLVSATLFARQRFVAASFAPLVYNLGTIAGGALLGRALGTKSLAVGTLAGAFLGPFLIQAIAAHRAGLRYRPTLHLDHPDVRAWVRLSVPLMVGVSLVTADDWIMRYFAAGNSGAISCLSYARKLVLVPIAVAGQAVGQASMPFFARLFAEGKRDELSTLVVKSARASATLSAFASFALIALAEPMVDLLFRRGHFTNAEVATTARDLRLFALAIPLWSVQGIVSRAFYASRDTIRPMVGGTFVMLISLPVYAFGFRYFGPAGLVAASGIGILLHTALLLGLLPLHLPNCDRWGLVAGALRAMLVSALAAAPAYLVAIHVPHGTLNDRSLLVARLASGGCVYLTLVLLLARPFKLDDVDVLLKRFRRASQRDGLSASNWRV
jgi:putative peptidoglycan lipid II flippase